MLWFDRLSFWIIFTGTILGVRTAILKVGNPLSWTVAKPYLKFIRNQGIRQLLIHYNNSKGSVSPEFLWGDEIEYGIFKLSNNSGNFDLSLRSQDIRGQLKSLENDVSHLSEGCVWQPEYGNWMVEATPRDPYTGYISDLLKVEQNMQLRRRRLHHVLLPDEISPSITVFPMLGVGGYDHCVPNQGPASNSAYISDKVINPHPRFPTLTNNIRERRGSNVNISVPAYKPIDKVVGSGEMETVHMDAMAFGMGCCCVQVTMQCRNEYESRLLADQLAVLSPLFLALSASTPIAKGHLLATDTRWDIISKAVDDRTAVERGDASQADAVPDPEMVGGGVRRLQKSRYSSVSLYIGEPKSKRDVPAMKSLNDLDAAVDEETLSQLKAGGMDEVLAAHVAHMFVRDPLVIFDDTIPPAVSEDEVQPGLEHFESLQSTNWRTVRWKPPVCPPLSSTQPRKSAATSRRTIGPGWRVEFRPMEVQLTDFENAALAILAVLTARCMLAIGHSLYMPMSLVEENMRRAQLENAVLSQKFYVRSAAFRPMADFLNARCDPSRSLIPEDLAVSELTLNEFFNGSSDFLGLIPAVLEYLEALGCDPLTKGRLLPYLTLLQKRASGELPTAAQWVRRFVASHPDHIKGSSQLSPATADALLQACEDIGTGKRPCPDLVGDAHIEFLSSEFLTPRQLLEQQKQVVDDLQNVSDSSEGLDDLPKAPAANVIVVPYRPSSVCSSGDLAIDVGAKVHLDAALPSNLCG